MNPRDPSATELTLRDVLAAADRIGPYVHRTPVLTSNTFDLEIGAALYFKCENLQKVGAFKARGAINAAFAAPENITRPGFITHSSGNHGQALAFAAATRGVPAIIVMPDDTPAVKRNAVEGYGARVELVPRADRATACARLAAETGAHVVHPFENPFVIAGQGTAVLELLDEVPDLDAVIVPVGGGGLAAGTALVLEAAPLPIKLCLAEPAAVDDAVSSLETGKLQPGPSPDIATLADGLRTGLGAPNFEILQRVGATGFRVSEDAMQMAGYDLMQRMKLLVEPSGATVLAAIREHSAAFSGMRVGVILSGGNTDLSWWPGFVF